MGIRVGIHLQIVTELVCGSGQARELAYKNMLDEYTDGDKSGDTPTNNDVIGRRNEALL